MNNIESKPKDLETVKGWLTIARENNNKLAIQIIENLFPEVQEVMDLRIKEAVLKMVHDTPSGELEDNYSVRKEEVIDWLEKQAPKPKQSWSKRDKSMIQDAIHWIQEFQKSNRCKDENDMQNSVTCENWLKSFKPQIARWMPGEYDISLLEEIARNIRNDVRPFCSEVSALEDLINELKNL